MAKRQVVVTTCDQCGREAETDLPQDARARYILPDKWMHVTGNTRTVEVFAMDLCDQCVQPVLGIAGRWKRESRVLTAV